MGRVFGLIGLMIALFVGSYIYMQQAKSVSQGTNNPRAAADITGVKMDLIHMAQAERAYFARENHYASLEDLHADRSKTCTLPAIWWCSRTTATITVIPSLTTTPAFVSQLLILDRPPRRCPPPSALLRIWKWKIEPSDH